MKSSKRLAILSGWKLNGVPIGQDSSHQRSWGRCLPKVLTCCTKRNWRGPSVIRDKDSECFLHGKKRVGGPNVSLPLSVISTLGKRIKKIKTSLDLLFHIYSYLLNGDQSIQSWGLMEGAALLIHWIKRHCRFVHHQWGVRYSNPTSRRTLDAKSFKKTAQDFPLALSS